MSLSSQHRMEDAIITYQGLVQDVDRAVMSAAMHGRMGRDSKLHAVYKLERAIQTIRDMPEGI